MASQQPDQDLYRAHLKYLSVVSLLHQLAWKDKVTWELNWVCYHRGQWWVIVVLMQFQFYIYYMR